jgi:hypothetical protein
MFKFFRISFVLIVVAFASVSIFGQNEWIGRYEFSEDGGKNAVGTAIFVQHELEVVEGDDGLIAFLKSNGYQTSKDLICTSEQRKGRALGERLEATRWQNQREVPSQKNWNQN